MTVHMGTCFFYTLCWPEVSSWLPGNPTVTSRLQKVVAFCLAFIHNRAAHCAANCICFILKSALQPFIGLICFTSAAPSTRRACGSSGGQPLQAVAPPRGSGVPVPQMHLHVLQRPLAAASPAEARWDQALPVPALLLRQQPPEPAGRAPAPRAQSQSNVLLCSYADTI